MTETYAEPVRILLVDDSPGDVSLTREAFGAARIANELSVAVDGRQALSMLRREGVHADTVRPDLVLLDLNLPGTDGRAVLSTLKSDPDLGSIPVIVLTTSSDEADIRACYRNHASCFITKPVDFGDFLGVVGELESFWLQLVKLPPRQP